MGNPLPASRHLIGWVFDVIPGPGGMTVWFRAEAGETVPLSAPFRPSFVLAGKNLKEASLRAASSRWNCSLARWEGTGFFSGRTIPAWTFTVAAPALLGSTVRKAEKAFGPEALFNADIAPEQQFAYATGLYPLSRAHVECAGDGTILSSRILDSPWEIDAPLPFFSTALLRTEGKGHPAHGRVRPLELTAGGITHVLLWEDGAEFLRELLRLLRNTDPDLLVTEYGDDYLLPRLLALAGRLRVPLPLGRPRRAAAEDYRELAERITGKTGMPIALEGVYRWLAFLPSKRNPKVAVPNRFAGAFSTGEIKARGIAMRRSDTPPMVAALQRELLERMAAAETIADLRALPPELREIVERAVAGLHEGRIPPEALAVARRLSKAPEQYVANTAAAAVTRELCGRGVTLRPGSKIRYLLADGKGRAMGFLDGNETPDFARYEEMLREAEEELLGLIL